jgi:hypothetical protein
MAVLGDDDVVVHRNAERRAATSTMDWVIWMSARAGVGSPDG